MKSLKSWPHKNITTKNFRLQPEYRGKRRIKVTVRNISMQVNGEILAAYLSSYGSVEDFSLITSAHGTAYVDYTFTMILDRGGVNAIPHTISYRDTTITVIVEGRKPLCWHCKQLGHFSRSYPQKTIINKTIDTTATIDTITTTTATTTTTTDLNTETTDHANKKGWILVKGGNKKTPETRTKKTVTETIQMPSKKEMKKKSNRRNGKRDQFKKEWRRGYGDGGGEKNYLKPTPPNRKSKNCSKKCHSNPSSPATSTKTCHPSDRNKNPNNQNKTYFLHFNDQPK